MAAKDLYSKECPIESLIDSVCIHPAMYTSKGAPGEVAAFLQGFQSGMAHLSADIHELNVVLAWNQFVEYAIDQLSEKPGSWIDLMEYLEAKSGNEEEVFQQLAALCIQFRKHTGLSLNTGMLKAEQGPSSE